MSREHKRRRRSNDDYREKKQSHRRHDDKSHTSFDDGSYSSSSKRYDDSEKKFSFLNYQSELNSVLMQGKESNHLIKDRKDFWLFIKKYEDLLEKSGQSIINKARNNESECNDFGLPKHYDKRFTINLRILNADDLYNRIPVDYSREKPLISKLEFDNFIDVVTYYLDFKQKEKFNKLKKIRDTQANLPIAQYKQQIAEAVEKERVVIIAGDTGCGKSTQVPQYLNELGYDSVACTQPRRIACISLSKRVSYEMLNEFGSTVGYQIRFERNKNKSTEICFITEGLLLRQMSSESTLSQYKVLVLDEVHERHLHGDFLLGIVKCLLQSDTDLKIILMSATINIELFGNYFANEKAVVIQVPGRLYPIELHYRPAYVESQGRKTKADRMNVEPYVQIMQLIDEKYPKTEKGDLLIFLSGISEITAVIDAANAYNERNGSWIVLPLHSTLSIAEQDKVFDYAPDGIRKCIVSTNIAETSVTIDGIRFVADSGKVKEMSYDTTCKMQRLKEFWISKASAEQRKGRAGRTGPGVCFRLYSQEQYAAMDQYTTPELQRVPLDSLLLQMISMGLPDARKFPFIEPPAEQSIEDAILSLKQHGALTGDEKLTCTGKALARIPVDIILGKMLLSGSVFHQVDPVLSTAAALSVQSPFTNRAYRDLECERARQKLESDHGDPITLLNSYRGWLEVKYESNRDSYEGNSRNWCKRRGFEEQRFYEITKLRNQFRELLQDCGILENRADESMSSTDRSIRHGELKQLRQMRRAYKESVPQKRKILKSNLWTSAEDQEDEHGIDIKDVEFRMSHDNTKLENLMSSSTACSYKDLTMLKLILCSGLYPQVAIADEFNYCKSPMEQLFHTQSKPYTSLHPMSFFGNHPQILQLEEQEIIQPIGLYKSRLPLSSKHQLLCYLSLMETTKPYLMNTMRMPAAQTLLLFAHCIDTNSTFSRVVCDSWLQLDFPVIETGQTLILKAVHLRAKWEKLLNERLRNTIRTADEELKKMNKDPKSEEFEWELTRDLVAYMNTDVPYTIKRLLPIDSRVMYTFHTYSDEDLVDPNPFDSDFKCTQNEQKGGVNLTPNVVYNCLEETDWSLTMANEISETEWMCPKCEMKCCMTGMQKLQHQLLCNKSDGKEDDSKAKIEDIPVSSKTPGKEYECPTCKKTMQFTCNIEILRHRKSCVNGS